MTALSIKNIIYHRLPRWIINKHAVTNVRNTGNDCFKWAFLAGMHPTKRYSDRLKKYENFQSKYDFSSLTYPIPLKDNDTFCSRNNCSINVYGISGGKDDQSDIEGDIEDDDTEDGLEDAVINDDLKDDDDIKDDNDDIDDNEIEEDDQEVKSIPNVTSRKRKEWYTH